MSRDRKTLRGEAFWIIMLAACLVWGNAPETGAASSPAAGGVTVREIAAEDISARVDEYMNAHLRLILFGDSGPGYSVLIARQGRVLVSKGYGCANCEHGVRNTPETKFRIGSLTKQFTAIAVMQLHEKGRLNIADSLDAYIPDYPGGEGITIHHLLTHTSGIPCFTRAPDYVEKSMTPSSVTQTLERFKHRPLAFPPGGRFGYSSSGYIILTFVIEKVSGQSYEEYIQEHILEPLGMKNSGYDHREEILPHRAAGYSSRKDGFANAPHIDMSTPAGAGGLYSTVEDLYRWDRALYTEKVVSRSSLARVFTPCKEDYGYGWNISQVYGNTCTHHGGRITGFVGYIERYLEDEICVVVLSNFADAPIMKVARDLAAIVFGKDVKAVMPEDLLGASDPVKSGVIFCP